MSDSIFNTWTSISVAKVGSRFHVKVESKTSEGEGYPHGGVQVKGEMRSKVHSGAVVYGEVEDHRDGTCVPTPSSSPLKLVVLTNWSSQWMDLYLRFEHIYQTLYNS